MSVYADFSNKLNKGKYIYIVNLKIEILFGNTDNEIKISYIIRTINNGFLYLLNLDLRNNTQFAKSQNIKQRLCDKTTV